MLGNYQANKIYSIYHQWCNCDNSSRSFDTLIPLLPKQYSYLAIDLPGHGFSSHLPKGTNYYHLIDLVPLFEEIRVKFKWQQLSLIAHSFGAMVSFCYAAFFPENVDFVCALDTLKPQNLHPKMTEHLYERQTKRLIRLLQNWKQEQPDYTYDELVSRSYEGSQKSVEMDKIDCMMKRGSKPSPTNPNKFYYSRDIRVKCWQPFDVEQKISMEYIKRIRCAYLFIRSDDTTFSEPQSNIDEAVQQFEKYNKTFELLKVNGTHHVHLNNPELIAEKVGNFLQKYYISEEQQCMDFVDFVPLASKF